MKYTLKIFSFFLIALAMVSCDDEFEGEVVKDSIPEIPVTFEGATTIGFNPYYAVSYAAEPGTPSTFSITVKIPENSTLKIKEITKVVAGTTAINVASLSGVAGQYLAAPIAVNGNSFTLSSSITEYNSKVTGTSKVSTAPAAGAFTERAFMFLLTMEDGSQIVPVQCRIRVTP